MRDFLLNFEDKSRGLMLLLDVSARGRGLFWEENMESLYIGLLGGGIAGLSTILYPVGEMSLFPPPSSPVKVLQSNISYSIMEINNSYSI